MLSPRWQSVRISPQPEIVRLVPPPPLELASCCARRETAVRLRCQRAGGRVDGARAERDVLPIVSTMPVNMLTGALGRGGRWRRWWVIVEDVDCVTVGGVWDLRQALRMVPEGLGLG